jgi:hypothetical protein
MALGFIGIPPIPQEKAEWMGHGGLQQKVECSRVSREDPRFPSSAQLDYSFPRPTNWLPRGAECKGPHVLCLLYLFFCF